MLLSLPFLVPPVSLYYLQGTGLVPLDLKDKLVDPPSSLPLAPGQGTSLDSLDSLILIDNVACKFTAIRR